MSLQRRAGRALTVVSRWNSAALLGLRSGWHCLTRSRYAAFSSLREAPGRTPSTASWEACLMATGGIRQERSREACKGRGQAAWASATRPVSPEAAKPTQRPAGGGIQQAKPVTTVGRTPTSILKSRESKRRGNEAHLPTRQRGDIAQTPVYCMHRGPYRVLRCSPAGETMYSQRAHFQCFLTNS